MQKNYPFPKSMEVNTVGQYEVIYFQGINSNIYCTSQNNVKPSVGLPVKDKFLEEIGPPPAWPPSQG